jgi:hypothetical protein
MKAEYGTFTTHSKWNQYVQTKEFGEEIEIIESIYLN